MHACIFHDQNNFLSLDSFISALVLIKSTVAMEKKTRSQKTKEIYEIMRNKGEVSIKEIQASTDINYNTIRRTLSELTNAGLIRRVEKSVYQRTKEGKNQL